MAITIVDGRKRPFRVREVLPPPFSCKGPGIYAIINRVSRKIYIGSAVRLNHRWAEHRSQLATGTHGNRYLQRAFSNEPEGFEIQVVEELPKCSKQLLLSREQFWMDFYQSYVPEKGYNIAPKAESCQGMKQDPEVVAKRAKAQKGYKHTAESRANMSAAQRGTTKAKRDKLDVLRATMSAWGRPWTLEHRKKFEDWLKFNRHKCAHFSRPVIQMSKSGEVINRFDTIANASRATGAPECNIRGCLKHPNWTARGFKWRDA